VRKKPDFHPDKLLIISGGHFIHDVFSSFLAVFLPLLINKFELSMLLAGSLTVFIRLPSIFNPLIGIVSDRIDMRYLTILAPALTAIAMSLLGVAPSYFSLCCLLSIAGISAAVFHVLGPVMIARVSGKNIGTGMSYWMTAGELARTAGPLFGVWAVSFWGFERSYPVMIIGIFTSILLLIYLKDTAPASGRESNVNSAGVFKHLSHVMIPLTGIMISRAFMVATLIAFLPTYMVNSGKNLWFGGITLALLEFSGAAGTFLGGTLSDRIGRQTILLTAMPASCLLMLAFLYAPDWMLFPTVIFLGFSLFSVSPVNLAIVQDNSRGHRGAANGLYMGISFLTTAVVTVFVGWLADLFGLKAAFTTSAILGLAGIPIIFFLPKSSKSISKKIAA